MSQRDVAPRLGDYVAFAGIKFLCRYSLNTGQADLECNPVGKPVPAGTVLPKNTDWPLIDIGYKTTEIMTTHSPKLYRMGHGEIDYSFTNYPTFRP